jgi:hypothetical protein
MKKWFIFLFLFLLIPEIYAVEDTLSLDECYTNGILPAYCAEIKKGVNSGNLTNELGRRFMLNFMAPEGHEPQHEVSLFWNLNRFIPDDPPDGVVAQDMNCDGSFGVSGMCIEDAWVSTFGVNPSFVENNVLYLNDTGQVQAVFNYSTSKPEDQGMEVWDVDEECREDPPDYVCKYEYTNIPNVTLSLYQNDILIEANDVTYNLIMNIFLNFTSASQNKFISELVIGNEITETKYGWSVYTDDCCLSWFHIGDEMVCMQYGALYQCHPWEGKEIMTIDHELGINSSLIYTDGPSEFAFNYIPEVKDVTILVSEVDELPQVNITTENDNYILRIGNAEIQHFEDYYYVNTTHSPYNVFWMNYKPADETYISDGYVKHQENNTIIFSTYDYNVMNISNCNMTVLFPFSAEQVPCSLELKDFLDLDVSTDKLKYETGEEITVTVTVTGADVNIPITVVYGDQVENVATSDSEQVIFTAEQGSELLYATFEGSANIDSAVSHTETIYTSAYDWLNLLSIFFGIVLAVSILMLTFYFIKWGINQER